MERVALWMIGQYSGNPVFMGYYDTPGEAMDFGNNKAKELDPYTQRPIFADPYTEPRPVVA